MSYVPLFTKSNYSFLEGASHPEELVARACELGLPALAFTDRDGIYGVVRAYEESRIRRAAGEDAPTIIVGSQVRVDDGSTIVLLAMDQQGYRHLCALITRGRRRCEKGESQVFWSEVAEHSPGLIALWGGAESLLTGEERPDRVAYLLREAFGDRLYAMVTRHYLEEEDGRRALLRARAERYGLPLVAAVEVLYHQKSRRRLQDVLTGIKEKKPLTELGPLLRPNGEHYLPDQEEFRRRFREFPEAVERTLEIAARITFSMGALKYRYPIGELPEGYGPDEWLRELTLRGARKRYGPQIPQKVLDQLVHEFALIEELRYAGYFLTMKEIVDFCTEQEILCQGRGSAANSSVCYCLGITAIDPVELSLLFERFLSRERAEPPDIDLDIAHQRREEVIQFVYQRYGRHRAAMVANVIRYRPKSAVRDVGKTLGLTEASVDRLARHLSRRSLLSEEVWLEAELDPETPAHRLLTELSNEILEFPRHLAIHPGGFLLAADQISDLVPVENATMEKRTVIQWDKYDVEAMGLFKVDLLGLGALTLVDKAFQMIESHKGQRLSMATIPKKDTQTFDMICRAETIGTFQIESRAQMNMLPRLKPREYYDLVIQISLIRPGPITGDMVNPYLRRRAGKEEVDHPHPELEPVLARTLGIPIFQEQVMKLAIVAADYSPGEADQLRRDMASWQKEGRLEKHRHRLITRMVEKGIDLEFADRVFQQIQSYAGYGFPESHAASFALIAYATAYLRCHHPLAFTCALLNAQPMGFYSPSTIISEAQRRGIEVRPIDVSASFWDCTLERREDPKPYGFALRMGFRYLKGFREESGQKIVAARQEQPFFSLRDFTHRTALRSDDLRRLSESGALEVFEISRREAIWHIEGYRALRDAPLSLPLREKEEELIPAFTGLSHFETIQWDQRTSFHSPRGHPLGALRPLLRRLRLPTAEELNRLPDGRMSSYAGLVICRQRPGTAKGMVFMTLEDETGLVNAIIFPDVFDQFGSLIRTESFLGLTGTIQYYESVTNLIVQSLWIPRLRQKPRRAKSRDFH